MKDFKKEVQQERLSNIYAVSYVSESELMLLDSKYDSSWEDDQPNKFKNMLWSLGLDSRYDFKRIDGIQHRNKLNKVVACSRWIGNERTDDEWIKSGYASQEAIDKAKNSPLLDSLYKEKLFTVGTQFYLEEKDRCSKSED